MPSRSITLIHLARWTLIVGLPLGAFVAIFRIWPLPSWNPTITAAEVRRSIAAEVPPRSSEPEVRKFFASRGAACGEPSDPADYSDTDHHHQGTVMRGLLWEKRSWYNGGVECDFYLDRQHRVVRYEARDFCIFF